MYSKFSSSNNSIRELLSDSPIKPTGTTHNESSAVESSNPLQRESNEAPASHRLCHPQQPQQHNSHINPSIPCDAITLAKKTQRHPIGSESATTSSSTLPAATSIVADRNTTTGQTSTHRTLLSSYEGSQSDFLRQQQLRKDSRELTRSRGLFSPKTEAEDHGNTRFKAELHQYLTQRRRAQPTLIQSGLTHNELLHSLSDLYSRGQQQDLLHSYHAEQEHLQAQRLHQRRLQHFQREEQRANERLRMLQLEQRQQQQSRLQNQRMRDEQIQQQLLQQLHERRLRQQQQQQQQQHQQQVRLLHERKLQQESFRKLLWCHNSQASQSSCQRQQQQPPQQQ